MEYSLDKVIFDENKCHARKWDSKGATTSLGSTPYLQCNGKLFQNNLCSRCYKKEILWTGLITEEPPINPICVTASGKKSKKKWNYNSTIGLKTSVENDHKERKFENKKTSVKNNIEKVKIDHKEEKVENREDKLNLDEEFDFEELNRQSKLIKEKLKKSSSEHDGAPFSGLLDKNDNDDHDDNDDNDDNTDDTSFYDYCDLSYKGRNYKVNKINHRVLDISDVKSSLDADKITIVGTWDNENKRIV